MTPFFLLTTPRSRGTLLMRMLNATAGVRCAGESSDVLEKIRALQKWPEARAESHSNKKWPMYLQEPSRWASASQGLLEAWVSPEPGDTHFGVRSTFLGREGWTAAADWWSWMMEQWPESKMVFLGRDPGDIERSMRETAELWRGAYDSRTVKQHLESMQDFQRMNPDDCVYVDSGELLNYAEISRKLAAVGIPIDRLAWEQELAVVSGTPRDLAPPKPKKSKRKPAPDDLFSKEVPMESALSKCAKVTLAMVVGAESDAWRTAAAAFQKEGADILLWVYDDSDPEFPGAEIVKEAGWKFQFAQRYLSPGTRDFDYLFLWDGDVQVPANFSPREFIRKMIIADLTVAQPAILGYPNYHITRPRKAGETRVTDFVEIMAPVFTRRGWAALYPFLDPEIKSGWGYDMVPCGRKGIIDSMPVRHTRPNRSGKNDQANAELEAFLEKHGLQERAKNLFNNANRKPAPDEVRSRVVEVFTLRYGKPDWLAACAPTLTKWCQKNGYPLRVISPQEELPSEKFACVQMVRDFLAGDSDVMVYVDADVVIHKDAPAWPFLKGFSALSDDTQKAPEAWPLWCQEHAPEMLNSPWAYRNAGVWQMDRLAAEIFLRHVKEPWVEGYMEQHQINVWWANAAAAGMRVTELPKVWNAMVSEERLIPGWFIHLAGRRGKLKKLRAYKRAGLLSSRIPEEEKLQAFLKDPFGDTAAVSAVDAWTPVPPLKFDRMPSLHPRAIVLPWLSKEAVWEEEELKHALRSWNDNFEDKDCPIYLFADRPPSWWRPGGRLIFKRISYADGKRKGFFQAHVEALQVADEILWTNDDFYLLKQSSWRDLKRAYQRGRLDGKADKLLKSGNDWLITLGTICRDLQKKTRNYEIWDCATHTPFYFHRDKAIEILENYHLRHRPSFETLYYNHHKVPLRPVRGVSTRTLPAPNARFLFHHDKNLTGDLKTKIAEAFPDPAPWEQAYQAPREVPKIIHQTWKDADIPYHVYPKNWVDSWRKHHPGWDYRLWTDEDLQALADEHYPEFSDVMRDAVGVVRADFGRLLVLYHFGGLYVDLDYAATKPMDGLLKGGETFLSTLDGNYVHNALMATAPGVELFYATAEEGLQRFRDDPTQAPEYIAGPGTLTFVSLRFPYVALPQELVCPIDWRRKTRVDVDERYPDVAFPDAHAVTFWRHNWGKCLRPARQGGPSGQ